MDPSVDVVVRTASASDSAAVIGVVRNSWTAYPGVVFDLDGELPELKVFAHHYERRGGRAWVAVLQDAVVGCIATTPRSTPGSWMLHKLNVLSEARRRGIGVALVKAAEAWARSRGAREMTLWSDTRFVESHALYRSLGYAQMPEMRRLDDLSNTEEFLFRKSL